MDGGAMRKKTVWSPIGEVILGMDYHQVGLAQFNIPIPFGNIGLKKGDDGNKFAEEDAALVNGSPFGGSGALRFDKDKGIDIGQNVTLGNQTAVGGPGRETNFLADLLSAINQLFPKPSQRTSHHE
ncbi:hypothetical protein TELCIR_01355 [Teladorsagia circumcincta]|uniref:Uncharacterized protein n=1 Tax=Teladorsagia circumcincta TaxID=45464 RepID=A0A2G9V243_TELCI|nr:hypothetical protein TELCIR_01355 [Teladorsagia circumcincta]